MVTRSSILRKSFPLAIVGRPLTINQDQRALVFHDRRMSEFVYWALKSQESRILKECRKTGTTVESIIWEKFIEMLLPVPPLAEQNRIIGKIDLLIQFADTTGNKAEVIAKVANRIDKKILSLAIRGQLVSQNENDEPALQLVKRVQVVKKSCGKRSSGDASFIFRGSDRLAYETKNGKTVCIEDQIPFTIPDSWEWVRLGSILLPTETKLPQGEWFEYIDIDAIDNKNNVIGFSKRIAVSNAPSRASRGLQAGDTLFSLVRPYLRNIAFVDESFADCIASTGFYVCRPCEIFPRFLYWELLSDYVVNGLNSFMTGDNSPSIRKEHIQMFLVPLPPLAEQKRIVAKVEELREMTRALTM